MTVYVTNVTTRLMPRGLEYGVSGIVPRGLDYDVDREMCLHSILFP